MYTVVVNVNNVSSLIVDGREEKISAAKKEPSQIMQEVIRIAAATPSSECVLLFCAWICIVLHCIALHGIVLHCIALYCIYHFWALCISPCWPWLYFVLQNWKFSKRWWHFKWRPNTCKRYSVKCNSCYIKNMRTNCVQITVMKCGQLHARCKQCLKHAKELSRLLETEKEEITCSVRQHVHCNWVWKQTDEEEERTK